MRRSYVGDVSLFGTLAYEDLVPADVKRLRHLRGVVFTDKLRLSYVKNGRIEPTEADYTLSKMVFTLNRNRWLSTP